MPTKTTTPRRRSLPVAPTKSTSCTCKSCQSCCTNVPGWFTPRDVKRLIERYPRKWPKLVAFDRWYNEDEDDTRITVMAPPNKVTRAGEEYPEEGGGWGWLMGSRRAGACKLLVKGRCSIHSHKPNECRHTFGQGDPKCKGGYDTSSRGPNLRGRIARAWARPAAKKFLAAVRAELQRRAQRQKATR